MPGVRRTPHETPQEVAWQTQRPPVQLPPAGSQGTGQAIICADLTPQNTV